MKRIIILLLVIKALELPGLWSGVVRDWNTKLLEKPAAITSTVKTTNELLCAAH